ncbi:MAG: MBL fold metallo-hydrolase [Elusimicrobia bacterium]|nr:MBL fold metallo-hydrolase [Elusimicrobiota bacterium]
MKVRFWGVRGSIPAPGPSTSRYGGNTPCVELRAGGREIVVDAGTGLRGLGDALIKEKAGAPIEADLFVGHTHWDHIQGLPFFVPLYMPGTKLTVHGVHGTTRSLREVLSGQMSSAYFPVRLDEAASKPRVEELSAPVELGPVKVSYHYLNHPGIAVGFRFEEGGRSVVYLSDHEPYDKLNAKGEFSRKEDADVARFAQGADLLICEAQYTKDEYKLKKGWGHSTFDDVLDLAGKAGVKRLALFHHDPSHDDDAMDALAASCVRAAAARGEGLEVFAAREGQELSL